MRRIKFIMGLPITVDIPYCEDENILDSVFAHLREIDRRFSPYKINSELRKFQRGKIEENDLSAEFKNILSACNKAEEETDGYFSAYYSGKFDPSGYVKGWAADQAGRIIEKSGFKTYCIGAGGDILARSDSEKIWKIGILNPKVKHDIIGKISSSNFAVATSGSYERGKHIVNPKTGKTADDLLSVSVTGPDIIKSDILATAIFAAGMPGLNLLRQHDQYEALAVEVNGQSHLSEGMAAILETGNL
jgi:thiamine biosynthesis lipoprotein